MAGNPTVIFAGPRQVVVEDKPIPEVRPGEVIIRTHCSLISTGTELSCLLGDLQRGGIWTGFGEDGTSNYQRGGWPDEHDPKLQRYMDRHGLYGEWHDPGTLMIYPA